VPRAQARRERYEVPRAQARREPHEVLSCGRNSSPGTPHWPAAPTAGA
jgi:hypothetical protein